MEFRLRDGNHVEFGAGVAGMLDDTPAESIAVVLTIEAQRSMIDQSRNDPMETPLRITGRLGKFREREASSRSCETIENGEALLEGVGLSRGVGRHGSLLTAA
jgi:hypothetical protein